MPEHGPDRVKRAGCWATVSENAASRKIVKWSVSGALVDTKG